MMTHNRAAIASRRARPSLPLQPREPWAALVDCLGSSEDEASIIVLGRDGPDLMCALLRAGAPHVTHLCAHAHLESESASLVIVPRLPSLTWLDGALSSLRRALVASGRLAVCIDPLPATQQAVQRKLTVHAFTAMRATCVAGRLVITAEVPTLSLRRCA